MLSPMTTTYAGMSDLGSTSQFAISACGHQPMGRSLVTNPKRP